MLPEQPRIIPRIVILVLRSHSLAMSVVIGSIRNGRGGTHERGTVCTSDKDLPSGSAEDRASQ